MSKRTSYFEQEIREQPEVLAAVIEDPRIAEVADHLRERPLEVIATLARGSSDNAVTFFAYLAGRYLGLPVASLPPSLFSVYRTRIRAEKALVIAVSQSGESSDVIAGVEALGEAGALSVAISNGLGSPLARAATYSLEQHAGLERAVAASKTFSSQMMVLACLAAHWSGEAELTSALQAVPAALEGLLGAPEAIRQAAERLTHAGSVYLLGRGLSYAPALETALKLKETAYLHAQAYSSAEFQHGPIAALDTTDPVVLLACQDGTEASNRVVLDQLHGIAADVVVAGSSPSLLEAARNAVALPQGLHPVTESFLLVVVGQLLALYLTHSKGLDPDAPRYLHKVTRTM